MTDRRETLLALADALDVQSRTIRALAVLESINSPEAKQLIAQMASGLQSARITREAKETLERLGSDSNDSERR